jgi:hypothetical protein
MKLEALTGAKIEKITLNKNSITFSTLFHEIIANVEVVGVTKILKNSNVVEKLDTEICIDSMEIIPLDIEKELFSLAKIVTVDGDSYELHGNMKGNILNMQDFFECLCDENDEVYSDYNYDENRDCCGYPDTCDCEKILDLKCDNLNCCCNCSCEDCNK